MNLLTVAGNLLGHPAGLDRVEVPAAGPTPARLDDQALREACAQLEGVFLEQLMKALRETVPEGGLIDGGAGEEIFTSLLDAHFSSNAASQLERGIGAAIYRQLRGPAAEPGVTTAGPTGTDSREGWS